MKITIITVGKIKEKYLRDAIAEYSKRLSRYCKLEIIEVADEKTVEHASEAVEDSIRSKEAERILKYVKEDAYVITLEINGEQLTSEQLAAKVEQLGIQGTSHLWRVNRTWKRSPWKIRLCLKFFKDDLPSSTDAGDPAGTDLSQLPDHKWRTIS
mgnify:CR=1 FL=1